MATNANLNKQPIGWVRQTSTITAAQTLVDTDSGTVYFISNASGAHEITLPTTLTAGVNYEFYVLENTPGAAITIAAGSAIVDLVMKDAGGDASNSTAGTAVSNIIIGTSAEQGDWVRLITDGNTWYATALSGINNAITTS